MTRLIQDIRYAARSLRRSPGFVAVATITLAIGIGATTAIFALVHAVVIAPLPYPQANRLVHVGHPVPGLNPEWKWGVSEAGFWHFLDSNRTFGGLAAFQGSGGVVSGDGDAEQVPGALATANLFEVLGARPALGRLLRWEDNEPGSPQVVVLGHEFWQTRYGGDPSVVGRSIDVNGFPREVVGVTEAGFGLPTWTPGLWLPVQVSRSNRPVNWHRFTVVGRLRDGTSLEAAQADLAALTAQLPEVAEEAYPPEFMEEAQFAVELVPFREQVVGEVARVLWILLGAVGLVLLIACVNVANLFIVRMATRRREIAVRTALGATRGDIVRRFGGETVLLGLAGGALGLGLAWAMMRVVVATEPGWIPRLAEVGLGWQAVAFALGVAILAGAAFGAMPALRRDPDHQTLRESGATSASPAQIAVRRALVSAQVGVAVVLLAGAALMLESYRNLMGVHPGFEPSGVLTAQIALPFARYGSYEQANAFWHELVAEVGALPGVTAVGATQSLPMAGAGGCSIVFTDDPVAQERNSGCFAATTMVTPGYFDAMGIRVRGRTPTWADTETRAGEVVITQAVADRLWPGEDAIGKGIKGNGASPPFYRIVGVTEQVRANGLAEPPIPEVFFPMLPIEGAPLWSPPMGMVLVARQAVGGDPTALAPAIREIVRRMDGAVPVQNVRAMNDVVAESMARTSFTLILLGLAGAVALIIGLVGLYGVVSYLVEERRREIGIRMALGADRRRVAGMVLGQSAILAAAGIGVGVVAAVFATRVLQSLLFEVGAADPRVLAGVSVLLFGVALLAAWLPARRAMRVDPMTTLKAE
jgi:putative ABC transport system permease protein